MQKWKKCLALCLSSFKIAIESKNSFTNLGKQFGNLFLSYDTLPFFSFLFIIFICSNVYFGFCLVWLIGWLVCAMLNVSIIRLGFHNHNHNLPNDDDYDVNVSLTSFAKSIYKFLFWFFLEIHMNHHKRKINERSGFFSI